MKPPPRKGFWESALLKALRRAGAPEPEREAVFSEGTPWETWPDFTWRRQRVAVYVDELYWHSGGQQVDGDHARRNRLRLDHDLVVLVYTDHQIQNWPDRCAKEIAEALQRIAGRDSEAAIERQLVGAMVASGSWMVSPYPTLGEHHAFYAVPRIAHDEMRPMIWWLWPVSAGKVDVIAALAPFGSDCPALQSHLNECDLAGVGRHRRSCDACWQRLPRSSDLIKWDVADVLGSFASVG